MINCAEKIHRDDEQSGSSHLEALRNELTDTDKKLDTLLDLNLNGDITREEYPTKKEKLTTEKYNLRAKIHRAQGGACQWFEPVVNLINQAKSIPNQTKTANQAELGMLLKRVGWNRHRAEREIKVFPRKAWEILILGAEKKSGGYAPVFISSGDSPNNQLLVGCDATGKVLELKNHFLDQE